MLLDFSFREHVNSLFYEAPVQSEEYSSQESLILVIGSFNSLETLNEYGNHCTGARLRCIEASAPTSVQILEISVIDT